MAQVLVVDRDPAVHHLLASVLAGLGHDAVVATDVNSAIAHLGSGAPDLVVGEVGRADHAGFLLLQTVRERLPAVPFVSMAEVPAGAEDALHIALSLGASDTLLKPLEEARLVASMKRLLDCPSRG